MFALFYKSKTCSEKESCTSISFRSFYYLNCNCKNGENKLRLDKNGYKITPVRFPSNNKLLSYLRNSV